MKPYETIRELLEDSKIHGPYVKKPGDRYYLITAIYKVGANTWACVLDGYRKGALTPQELLTECTWQDGSPCGKSIEVTVEEFISKLSEFPKDAEVVICEYNPYHGDLEKNPEPDYYPHENKIYL